MAKPADHASRFPHWRAPVHVFALIALLLPAVASSPPAQAADQETPSVSTEEPPKSRPGDFLGGIGDTIEIEAVLTLPGTAMPGERSSRAGHPQNLIRGTAAELRTALAAHPGAVLELLRPPHELAVTSEGTLPIGTSQWHGAGVRGAGVKVAIVDSGFDTYASKLGNELPANVVTRSFRPDGDLTPGTRHGTAVAEIVYDIAPEATFYLINLSTDYDMPDVVDYLIAEDIDVVNMSLGWTVGPFDGTSPVAQEVQRAIDAGIIWVNAAGNEAENHWRGPFRDTNGDRWMEYAGADITNSFRVPGNSFFYVDVTWEGTADLDIALRDSSGSILTWGASTQLPGSRPIESLVYYNDAPSSRQFSYSIYRWSGSPIRLDAFTASNTAYDVEYNVKGGSVNAPGDVTNVVTVGATPWYATSTVASYSSRGPTIDGRIKPDVLGPASVSTTAYGTGAFAGTSAASPHVAGIAALHASVDPSLTPSTFMTLIESQADPLPGQSGKTNNAGWGFARLGSLPPPPDLACDVDGDGYGDLPFGSPGKDVANAQDSGMIHVVFGMAGTLATSETTVTPYYRGSHSNEPGPAAHDQFGQTLACGDFDGDGYDDIAIGAPGETIGSHPEAGAVHIAYGSASGVSPTEAVWHRDTPGIQKAAAAGDRFGASLAAGDFDGDGYDDLAVGAPGTTVGVQDGAGSLTVLYGSATGISARDLVLTQGMTPMPTSPQSGENFAAALAAGDIDNDGFDDIVIGSPREFVPTKGKVGAFDVIYGSGTGLDKSTVERLHQASAGILDTPSAGDDFAAALAIADIDGDDHADVVVGVPGKTVGGAGAAGQVHVVYGSSGGISRRDAVVIQGQNGAAGTAQQGDMLGTSLTVGDFDRNGFTDIAAGVPGQRVSGNAGAGAVHVIFNGQNGLGTTHAIWHRDVAGVPHTAIAGDAFGTSVTASDLDGDGSPDLIVGAPLDNIPGAVDAGSLSIFYGASSNPLGRFADVLTLDSPGVGFKAKPGDRSGSVGPHPF